MTARFYNVHERARQMVAQARGTLELSEAYARLARRAAAGRKNLRQAKQHTIKSVRLPYSDSP